LAAKAAIARFVDMQRAVFHVHLGLIADAFFGAAVTETSQMELARALTRLRRNESQTICGDAIVWTAAK
jgi:hypothetical protein